jgi:hypothetical protein
MMMMVMVIDVDEYISDNEGRTEGGAAGLHLPPETPKNRNLKDTDFIGTMISKALHDLPFSQNQLLKSADD